MGKLLSFLANREKQGSIFDKISNNDKIQWDEPTQRRKVTEAAKAARRLSLYEGRPKDIEQKQYIEDQKKVEVAIDVIKANYKKENKEQMEAIIEEVKQHSEDTDIDQNQTENQINTENQTHNQIQTEINEDQHNEEDIEDEHKQIETQHNNDAQKQLETDKDNQYHVSITNHGDMDQKQIKTEVDKEEKHHTKTTYSGVRIQIDQCYSFKHKPWILEKDRESKQQEIVKSSNIIDNIDEYHSNRRVTLSNSHNFLWFTTAIQSVLDDILENDAKLTRNALDTYLNLLPIPFIDKIWDICISEDDAHFVSAEDYAEFVDSLLIATGQFDIDDDIDDLGFEIRDMNKVFCSILDVDNIFKIKINTSKWSKTALCLSTKGATELIKAARNMHNEHDMSLDASDDMAIALLTGFTRKALKHAVTFCTQIFWKILTNIWWDEDDEYDMALPMSLDKYVLGPQTLDVKNKISDYQKQSLNAMSLEVLFPDLVLYDEDGDDIDHSFTQYLKVFESDSL